MRRISGLDRRTAGLVVAFLAVLAAASLARQRSPTRSLADDTPFEPQETQPVLSLLVPAYFHPSGRGLTEWDRLIAAAQRAPIMAVANVATGPGEKVDPAYSRVIRRAIGAGVKVVGYVSTEYGKRTSKEIEADIQRWVAFYPEISGIFLDARAPKEESLPLYRDLRKTVEQAIPGALVISNPGTIGDRAYFELPMADLACVFENFEGFEKFQWPPWATESMRRRFAVLPYRIGDAEIMKTYLNQAVKSRFGTIYVTDAAGDNPWHRLPVYWDDEVEAVHRLNRHQAP